MMQSVAEIAYAIGGEAVGDTRLQISGIAEPGRRANRPRISDEPQLCIFSPKTVAPALQC